MSAAGLGFALLLVAFASSTFAQSRPDQFRPGRPVIYSNPYSKDSLEDPITKLQANLQQDAMHFEFDPKFGYLPSLLKSLGVNPDSQLLVFSKTSLQHELISPETPRAIYFGDNISIGYVQNSDKLEIASVDPRQGTIFYILPNTPSAAPKFERREDCLQCYQGPGFSFVAGAGMLSTYADSNGYPLVGVGGAGLQEEGAFTDHRSKFEDRWGGWYVSGTHGSARHMGNARATDPARPADLEQEGTQNLTDLSGRFDVSRYLVPTSDIVALMTMEHQAHLTNLLTRLGWQARASSFTLANPDQQQRLKASVEEMAEYMLFAAEDPIREPIRGVSSFTKTFPQQGPRDSQGRSLRDFDLDKRLFRYPLSYMIYSDQFDALPSTALELVYQRLFEVLTNQDRSPRFAGLSAANRQAALEILRETKPGLPQYWKGGVSQAANNER
jgi:hypothetical protein